MLENGCLDREIVPRASICGLCWSESIIWGALPPQAAKIRGRTAVADDSQAILSDDVPS